MTFPLKVCTEAANDEPPEAITGLFHNILVLFARLPLLKLLENRLFIFQFSGLKPSARGAWNASAFRFSLPVFTSAETNLGGGDRGAERRL
jgi:hypothetical protein